MYFKRVSPDSDASGEIHKGLSINLGPVRSITVRALFVFKGIQMIRVDFNDCDIVLPEQLVFSGLPAEIIVYYGLLARGCNEMGVSQTHPESEDNALGKPVGQTMYFLKALDARGFIKILEVDNDGYVTYTDLLGTYRHFINNGWIIHNQ